MMNQIIALLTTFKTGNEEYRIADTIRKNEFKNETTEFVLESLRNKTLKFGKAA